MGALLCWHCALPPNARSVFSKNWNFHQLQQHRHQGPYLASNLDLPTTGPRRKAWRKFGFHAPLKSNTHSDFRAHGLFPSKCSLYSRIRITRLQLQESRCTASTQGGTIREGFQLPPSSSAFSGLYPLQNIPINFHPSP